MKYFFPLEVTLPTCPALNVLSSRGKYCFEMSSIYWRPSDSQGHKCYLQGLARSSPTRATCTQQPHIPFPSIQTEISNIAKKNLSEGLKLRKAQGRNAVYLNKQVTTAKCKLFTVNTFWKWVYLKLAMLQNWCHLTVLTAAAAWSGQSVRHLRPALPELGQEHGRKARCFHSSAESKC